ncbi:hypothetical protein AMELA_G00194790 [Ameiurus melas]|uniref:Uncharacterized protein n=1 Tax=Ameiurus melas TaxID=219545 RepID=A0A7J6A5K9_AMEME|nr:hypothetical protein AMELA_G00194790 [Ameiurus melas]
MHFNGLRVDLKEEGHGEPGAYPRRHRAQGRLHPGQGASPSQGTICNVLCFLEIHFLYLFAVRPNMS